MTDLLSRPASRPTSPAAPSRPLRPLTTNALLAGAGAAAITLVLSMALALTGWFLADAGAHGDTRDALRVGADGWLVGHGSGLAWSGAGVGVVPLGLTLLLLVVAFRTGRWAARVSLPDPEPLRAVLAGLVTYLLAYGVVMVLTWVLASTDAATPGLGRGLLGAVAVCLVGGGLGLVVGTGELGALLDRLPAPLRAVLYGGLVGALALLAVAALVLAGSLLAHLNEAATVISALHLGVGDAAAYTFVTALLAPNAVLLTAAYLVGPGFALGTGTLVSPTAVSLGAVPAFPLLAAIPAEGPAPRWLLAVLAVPVLAGAVGAGLAQRRAADGLDTAYDRALLRGAGGGVLAGVLVALAVALAGGALGDGRLADVGAPFLEVLLIGCGGMGVGGMLGALAMTWWQRRR